MAYSILTEARVKGSLSDQQPEQRGYSTYWVENGNLEDWTTFIDLDIVGAWNGFLFGTKRTASGGFIGPSSSFTSVDSLLNDRIFFRMKYDKHPKNTADTNIGKIRWTTTSDPVFDDIKSVNFDLVSDGKWTFYEINMGDVGSWVGAVDNVRFFPCDNGAINDEFFLNFFEIGTNVFTFDFENPKAGTPGKLTGGLPLAGEITIEKGVNDKLILDIDSFGDVQLTLTPQTANPNIIARDISLQIGKVAIGGYLRGEAFVDDQSQKLIIESGIRASDSTVQVKLGDQSAAVILGLTNTVGDFLGTTEDGTNPDFDYVPLGSYKPTTLEILAMFDNDSTLAAFTLNPQQPVIEAGRSDFAQVNRKLRVTTITQDSSLGLQTARIVSAGEFDFLDQTLIDLNHPFTDDGELEKIFANGVFDPNGLSRWKIFRPNLAGQLTLVDEGAIGTKTIVDDPDGGLVTSPNPDTVSADVSSADVKVRAGDLLGISNASLHAGQSGTRKIDAMYYVFEGDITGTIDAPPTPDGAGEAGLAIYAVGKATKNRAVIDIDLGRRLNIDRIRVTGEEDQRDLEYNIGIASSATYSADTPGGHTVCFNVSPILRICFERTNAAFNLTALNDGQTVAENGITGFGDGGAGGLGGASVAGASYFYVNGDSEFFNTFEFVDQSPASYDFVRDTFAIDVFFSSSTPRLDKPIGKAVMYFKEKRNQRVWQIEFGVGNKGGDGSKQGFSIIPEDSIDFVRIDDKIIQRLGGNFVTAKINSDLSEILLRNPVELDTVAGGVRNPQRGVDFTENVGEIGGTNFREQVTFLDMQWNRFEWNFDTIRTEAFRWFCRYHFSTKIVEFEVYGVSSAQESLGDNVQILFSATGDSFTTAELVTANEKEAEYKLGNSPQFLRMIIRPTLTTSISDVLVDFEEDQVCFGEEGRILGNVTVEDARQGVISESTPILVTNNTGQTADLILDLPADIQTSKQLLFFSKLHSEADLIKPQVGPPAKVDFTPDKVLKETENVTINARAYGLLSLARGTENNFSDNLIINGSFESGDLTGWTLNTTQSGTQKFQSPRVYDISIGSEDESTIPDLQIGEFVFGFEMDNTMALTKDQFVPVHFTLDQTINVSEFASTIDSGLSKISLDLRHRSYSIPNPNTTIRIMGGPTQSGAEATAGTVIPGYGNNILRSAPLFQSVNIVAEANSDLSNFQAVVISGTRFVRLQVDVAADSERINAAIKRMKFLLDQIVFRMVLPELEGAKWYKAWRNDVGSTTKEFEGFTDASFVPIQSAEFVTTTGSTHWVQPHDENTVFGAPNAGQSVGFSNAFLQDRTLGIQSFRRMRSTDPGILGAQWEGQRDIAGLRIAFSHETSGATNAKQYPRFWHLEVLKTRTELGGIAPDLNNPTHARIVRVHRGTGPFAAPTTLTRNSNTSEAPHSRVTTWLFEDGPISTEGIKILFTLNCDRFEAEPFETAPPGATTVLLTGAEFTAFTNQTTCPDNLPVGIGWISNNGIGVSFFVPLEARNVTTLPITNEKEHNEGTSNIFVAVDLGRFHDIEVNSDLFELITTTALASEWQASTADFSDTDTDDPNLVVWAGGSSRARWIRYSCPAITEFEPEDQLVDSINLSTNDARVDSIPQGVLTQARIYPNLQKTLLTTIGYNSSWEDLGDVLTDDRNDTFIFYSDFPVIAIDMGKPYLLNNDSTLFRKNHDFITGNVSSFTDTLHWDQDGEESFAYSTKAFRGTDAPERIEYSNYGDGVPDIAIRWLAFKGITPLEAVDVDVNLFKQYNFRTGLSTLFGVKFRPRNEEVLTQNPNWFTTKKATQIDISTLKFTKGIPFSVDEGIDFGSGPTANIGPTINAFDGKHDELKGDVWGVNVRDTENQISLNSVAGEATGLTTTFLDNPKLDFPHFIWRVFRDPYRGEIDTKDVKSVRITGLNERFHPKDFSIQRLTTGRDPNLTNSWTTIPNAVFTDIDSFQDGAGFTHVFADAISTTGIRIFITDSEFPDDSVITQVDPLAGDDVFSTVQNVSGPQTRVASIQIFEEEITETALVGTLETDHVRGAIVSSLTDTPDHAIENIQDGDIGTSWQSTGFTDTITITLPRRISINTFEWEVEETIGRQTATGSSGGPLAFTLKAVIDGVPIVVTKETTFSGIEFTDTFEDPVLSDTFIFDITEVQGQLESAAGIILSEVHLIEEVVQTVPIVQFEEVTDRHPTSTNPICTQVTYAADADVITSVFLTGIDAGNDALWSQRDFFVFWVKINNINLFDTTFGNIKLGNDSTIAYTWNMTDTTFVTGWNKVKLQFKEAADISPIDLEMSNLDPDTGESKVDFLTPDFEIATSVDGISSYRIQQAPGIRYFEFEFRGTKGSEPLVLRFDDMQFERNTFEDTVKFAPSLYLNNSEFMTIHLNGIDLAAGTVEFWIQPDWSQAGKIRRGNKGTVIPALFRLVRPDGKFFNIMYRPNVGFVVLLFDGEKLINFVSNVKSFPFSRFDVFHFAVAWDANRRILPEKASLAMYIDGQVVYGTDKTWSAIRESGARVGFGGEISQRFGTTEFNNVALTFTPVPTLPTDATASSWAAIENLKIYNYAKTDYSDRFDEDLKRTQLVTPSEMLQISVDDINFESVGSINLPLVTKGVKDGEGVTLFTRTNIPSDLTGDENRDASVLVRWKTPLQECD